MQDAKYLIAFGQALAAAAAKADEPDHIVQFSGAAREAVVVERALHEHYFGRFGLDAAAVAAEPASPACHHYASFLLATAFREPLPVVVAALLPCFWVYREVGTHIHGQARADNPYRAWIDTYAGEDFAAAVDAMIATADALGGPGLRCDARGQCTPPFTRAMQLEWCVLGLGLPTRSLAGLRLGGWMTSRMDIAQAFQRAFTRERDASTDGAARSAQSVWMYRTCA